MEIKKEQNGSALVVSIIGRLDTTTAPDLEASLNDSLEGITDLKLDFEKLEYVSSAGLRVLLATQKKMNSQGKMVIANANDGIKEVFEITGFLNILTLE